VNQYKALTNLYRIVPQVSIGLKYTALSENVLIWTVVVFSTLETFCLMLNELFKFTLLNYLLTYALLF